MRYQTHIAAGVLIGALFPAAMGGIITAGIGAALPDIDSPFSKINQMTSIKGSKQFNNGILRHRGIMHTLLVPTLVLGVYWSLFANNAILPFVAGYLSHLALDACTRSGVAPFYPFSKKRIKGKVKTGSSLDKSLTVVFLVLLFAVVLVKSLSFKFSALLLLLQHIL